MKLFPSKEKSDLTNELTLEEIKWIEDNPVITLGMIEKFEPYLISNSDGEHSGFIPSFLSFLSKRLGVKIIIKAGPLKDIINMAKRGEIHGLAILHPEYAEKLGLLKTRTYIDGYPAIFARKDKKLNSPSGLAGMKVAIQENVFFTKEIARKYVDEKSVTEVPTVLDGLEMVQRKEADVFIGVTGHSYIVDSNKFDEITAKYVFFKEPYSFGMAFNKDLPVLVNIFNKGLGSVKANEINRMMRQWLQLPDKKSRVVLSKEENEWLTRNNNVSFGFTNEYEPFLIEGSDGKRSGILVDLLNEINRRLGTGFKLTVRNSFSEILQLAREGEIDGIMVMHPSSADKLGFIKSRDFLSIYPVLYSRRETKIEKPDDLKNRRVVIQKSYKYPGRIVTKYFKDAEIIEVDSILKALNMVVRGDADVFVGTSSVDYTINKFHLSGIVPKYTFRGYPENYCMSVRDGMKELVPVLNKVLDQIGKQEIDRIINSWTTGVPGDYSKTVLKSDEVDWLKRHPDIVLGAPLDIEPLIIRNADNELSGVMVDYLAMLNKRLGCNIRIEVDYWKPILDKASKREVDGIIIMHPGHAEKRGLLNTISHYTGYQVVYCREDMAFDRLDDFKGKKVVIIKGNHLAEKIISPYRESAEVLRVDDHVAAFDYLLRKKADYMIGVSVNSYLISKYMLRGIRTSYIFRDLPIRSVIGVRDDWPELVSILNKGISSITTKEKEALLAEWINIPAGVSGIKLTIDEKLWLDKHKIIKIGGDKGCAPIIQSDDKKSYEGLAFDYLKRVESMLDIKFVFHPAERSGLKSLFLKKEFDLVLSVTKKAVWDDLLSFTSPYLELPTAVFTRDDTTYITDVKRLSGKLVSVIGGSGIHDYLVANYPEVMVKEVNSPEEGLKTVQKGEAFAYICNPMIVSYLINRKGFYNIKYAGEFPFIYRQHIGVKKEWNIFRNILQKALDAIPLSEKNRIYNQWMPLTYKKPEDYSLFWKTGAGFALLVLIILFWNRSLASKVSRHTADLKISEAKYRGIYESLQDGYIKTDLGGRIIRSNKVAAEILGFDIDELLKMSMLDIYFDPADREIVKKEVLEQNKITGNEIMLKNKDGKAVLVEANIQLAYENGVPVALEGTLKDITKRKESERETARLASIIEQTNSCIVLTDLRGNVEYANPAFTRITGYSFDEVKNKKVSILKSGEHEEMFYKNLWDTIASGKVWTGEFANRNKKGHIYFEQAIIFPIFDEDGNIINFAAIKQDITETKALEKQLQQSQKMEAIGTLAGGIAHDFNNILGAIFGYTEMARLRLDEDSPIIEDLDEVLAASGRARDLVEQILAFSRKSELDRIILNPATLANDAMRLVRSSLPSTIRMEIDIDRKSGLILANPTQIHQIIMNLCTNAYHAMEDKGGVLRFTLLRDDSGRFGKGKFIRISVGDDGPGISEDVLEKIFDPYFTTKVAGSGTGLGLAITHKIVSENGGLIDVNTIPGEGSEFNVYLPVIEKKAEKVSKRIVNIPEGTESVLYVDDEVSLLRMGEKYLTKLGYKVTTEASSVSALELFSNNPDKYDLVITDHTMPDLTGMAFASELLKIRPDIPVILCTGYSKSINREKAQEHGIREFLQKPFTIETIANMIRAVLDK